jgi:hypothetical protein
LGLLEQTAQIQELLKTPCFDIIDKDFIVSFLVRHKQYALAADIYAKVPDRHLMAVKYALKKSFAKACEVLEGPLSRARDANACWLWALKTCAGPEAPPDCDWERLITGANRKGRIMLDDIFPLVPSNMELDAIHNLVTKAVQRTSAGIQQREKLRIAIEQKAEEQRAIINSQPVKPVELMPSDVKCFFCGQPACDAGFVVFPCGHVIHITCFVSGKGQDDQAKLKELEKSCPACGSAALAILDTPFIDPAQKWEVYERWRVPD